MVYINILCEYKNQHVEASACLELVHLQANLNLDERLISKLQNSGPGLFWMLHTLDALKSHIVPLKMEKVNVSI